MRTLNYLYSGIIWGMLGLFSLGNIPAQTKIHGKVTDTKGQTLIGANVFIPGTYDGATTDSLGYFSFVTTQKDTATLVASYLGYERNIQKRTLIQPKLQITFKLKSTATSTEAVIITAGAFEASDEKKGVVLNSIDIVTTAGATADIASALNTLPGTQTVGEDGQLFVRGGAAYETRTFIDGLRVQNPYGSRVPDVPARGRFSPFLFKGTLFSTGGYSAEYGQALSSALILNTQDLAPQTVTGISLMTVGAELSHTQRWDKTSLALSGSFNHLGPYFSLVKQNWDWNPAPTGTGGMMVFRHKPTDTGMFKVFSNFGRNKMQVSFPAIYHPQKREQFSIENDNIFVNTTYKELLGEKWILKGGFSYTKNQDQISFSEGKVSTAEQSGQAKVVLSNQINSRLKLKLGATALIGNFDETFTDTHQSEAHTILDETYGAVFSEVEWAINDKIAIRAGGRGEYSQLIDQYNLAPRFSMAYKTSEAGQISMAYGQFFQTPEYVLMRTTQNLKYERADHYILNYQWMKNRQIFRLEGYYKTYDQLVKQDPTAPYDPLGISNEGNGYARGIDIFWRDRKTFRQMDYWVSYSFLDTKRDYRAFPELAIPTFASKHNLSIVTKRYVSKLSTQFGLTYAFASPRPYHDPNAAGFNTGRTPAYHNLSFNASYLTNIWKNYTIVYVSLTNLLGNEQVFGYNYGNQAGDNGLFPRRAIQPPAKRFFFVGLFVSLTKTEGM